MAVAPGRYFAAVATGQGLSRLGSAMLAFGIGVYVFESSESAADYGTYLACATVGGAVGPSFVAGMVDRLPRGRLLIGFDSIAALTSLAVLLVVGSFESELLALSILAFLGNVADSCHHVTIRAVIPGLVKREKLLSANAALGLIDGLVQMAAPTLGALVYAALSLTGLVGFDLVTFVIAISMIAVIRIPPTPPSTVESHRIVANVIFGIRWIRERRPMRNLLAFVVSANIASGTAIVLAAPLVLTNYDEQVLGTALSMGAVGGVGGALLAMRLNVRRRQRAYLVLLLVEALALAGIAAGRTPLFYAAGAFLFFFAGTFVQALNNAIWQSETPSELRGRVFAVRTAVAMSVVPLTYLVVGWVAEALQGASGGVGGALLDTLSPIVGTGDAAVYATGLLVASAGLALTTIVGAATGGLAGLDVEDS